MAKANNTYEVMVDGMTEPMQVTTLGEVNKLIPGKRVTKKDIEDGNVPGVTILTASEVQPGLELQEVVEASDNVEVIVVTDNHTTEEHTEDATEEVADTEEEATEEDTTEEEPTESEEDDTDEDFEQPQRTEPVEEVVPGHKDSNKVTGKLAELTAKLKKPEPTAKTPKVKQDLAGTEVTYPEVGAYKEEGIDALKKFISRLSTEQLVEWAEVEGTLDSVKEIDNPSIYRMRVAMSLTGLHFPKASGSSKPKSKSKYAKYTTEELMEMAIDNDVEVKDGKGDMRIQRMYTVMALRNAGILD